MGAFSPYSLATGAADTAVQDLRNVNRAFRPYIYRLPATVEQQLVTVFTVLNSDHVFYSVTATLSKGGAAHVRHRDGRWKQFRGITKLLHCIDQISKIPGSIQILILEVCVSARF
jgi:hypothetical protein